MSNEKDYGITPAQYHAGLDKLWEALNNTENGTDDVFTSCSEAINEMALMLDVFNSLIVAESQLKKDSQLHNKVVELLDRLGRKPTAK